MEDELYKIYSSVERTHWWCVGRRQFTQYLIRRYFRESRKPVILDVGCNSGLLVSELQKKGNEVYGIDFSKKAIQFGLSQGVKNLAVGSLANNKLGCDKKKFDIIMYLDVLEHIKNDCVELKLIDERLTEGGLVIIMVPAFQWLWGRQDDISHHYRRYTRRDLLSKIQVQVGWKILKSTYFNTFLLPPIFLMRKLERNIGRSSYTDFDINNMILNFIFKIVFLIEIFLLRFISIPVGVSLCLVAKKINHPKYVVINNPGL